MKVFVYFYMTDWSESEGTVSELSLQLVWELNTKDSFYKL